MVRQSFLRYAAAAGCSTACQYMGCRVFRAYPSDEGQLSLATAAGVYETSRHASTVLSLPISSRFVHPYYSGAKPIVKISVLSFVERKNEQ